MMLIVLFLAVMAVASGARMSAADKELAEILSSKVASRAYEEELRALLEKVRVIMEVGDEELGIPVLDPLYIPSINQSIEIPSTALIDLFASTINIVGLKDFVVNNIGFTVLRLRLDYDFSLPLTTLTAAYYELDANILDNFRLFGNGTAKLQAINLDFAGFATITIKNNFLFMNNFQIKFKLEQFKSDIQGLLGGGEVSDLLNRILEELVPALVESQGEQLSAVVAGYVTEFANGYLTKLTLSDLIDIITGAGSG